MQRNLTKGRGVSKSLGFMRRQERYRRREGPPIARFAFKLANHQLGLVRLAKQIQIFLPAPRSYLLPIYRGSDDFGNLY